MTVRIRWKSSLLQVGLAALALCYAAPIWAATADLSIAVNYSNTRLAPGERGVVTITVTNLGGDEVTGLVWARPNEPRDSDDIAAGYPRLSFDLFGSGECGPDGDLNPTRDNRFGFQVFPNIGAGQSVTCSYPFTVDNDVVGNRSDVWSVWFTVSGNVDPNRLNNRATVDVQFGFFATSVPASSLIWLALLVLITASLGYRSLTTCRKTASGA